MDSLAMSRALLATAWICACSFDVVVVGGLVVVVGGLVVVVVVGAIVVVTSAVVGVLKLLPDDPSQPASTMQMRVHAAR